MDTMADSLNIESLMADKDSKLVIDQQLSVFIDFIIISCIFLLIIYWFYYIPYFNSEQKTLKKLFKFLNILPMSQLLAPKPSLNSNKTKVTFNYSNQVSAFS